MTPQQIVGIAVRLFAVWLVIYGFASFNNALVGSLTTGREGEIATAYTIGGLCLLAAFFLWLSPIFVAHKLIPRTQHTNYLSFNNGRELARVGCALIGLWLFAEGFLSLVGIAFWVGVGAPALDGTNKSWMILFALFEMLFAVLLINKAGLFARFVVPETKALPKDDEPPKDETPPENPSAQ